MLGGDGLGGGGGDAEHADHGDGREADTDNPPDNPLATLTAEEQLAMIGGASPGGRARSRRKSVFCKQPQLAGVMGQHAHVAQTLVLTRFLP